MDYIEMKRLMDKQKEEMTPKERLKVYLSGEEVDCIPYNIISPEYVFANMFGYTTREYRESVEVKCDLIEKVRDTFGMYSYIAKLGLKTIGVSLGSKVSNPENSIEFIEEFILDDYANLDKIKVVDPYNNPVLLKMLKDTKYIKNRFPDISISTSVAGPFSTASAIRPIEKLLRDTRKDKENLYRVLDLAVDSSLKWLEVFRKEFGVVGTSFADPVTCEDVLSYNQFKEHSLPYIKELIDGTKNIMGTNPSVHICGRTKGLWKDIADTGITSYSVDNCEDLEELKEAIGDRLVISGNVPPVDVMKNGTIDDVINSCRECIEKGAENPKGFILNTGCQVAMGTPKENIDAFIYAARKYGKGAKIGRLPNGMLGNEN